jgi:DNA adenine methylase
MNNLKPFIKWAGGKSQLLDELTSRIPKDKTEYVEPFVGGGALFLNQLDNQQFVKYTINDLNKHLYELYDVLGGDEETFYRFNVILSLLDGNYTGSTGEEQKELYRQLRDEFNNVDLTERARAAEFVILNKACFNGLYRENKKGEFNTPWGGEKKSLSINYDGMKKFWSICQDVDVTITNLDYRECLKYINKNSFVYLDPPYRPLGGTSNFNTYNAGGFTDEDQVKLKEFCDEINKIGAKFMLSNSDCPDGFFDKLYKDYIIERVYARRSINSKGDKRGKISELLIRNY